MKVLDLFSGIGGFSLGLERAGFETVAFCEIDNKAQQVLKKHWPHVPVFEDIKTLTKESLDEAGIRTIDVICGGFPCQDISLSGDGAGLTGARSGLWFEYLRLINEIKPAWAIIENVSALRARGLGVVLKNLWEVGYNAEWHCIPASAIGAHHQRDRIWIVAYPNQAGLQKRQIFAGSESYPQPALTRETIERSFGWQTEPSLGRVVDGLPGRVDRLKQLGNSVVPQIPEMIGRAIMRHNGN